MKDIFDECSFGDFKLNNRVIRTGIWETENSKVDFFLMKFIIDMKALQKWCWINYF